MPTTNCQKMTLDRGGRRSGGERRRCEQVITFDDRRKNGDRRHGTDRRGGRERRSPRGFRLLIGLDRREAFRQPALD